MSLSVDDFKARLGGGARPNLFRVTIAGVPEAGSFLCKGAALPASIVAQVDVPFRGRQFKVAGDRTFENWTTTVFNDMSFTVRKEIETWMNLINGHQSGTGNPDPNSYQREITVEQLSRDGSVLRTYTIVGAFPVNLGAIELSYDTNDTIEEYTIEFAYQYWTADTTS